MTIIFDKITGEIYSFATGNDQHIDTMFPDNYMDLKQSYDEIEILDEDSPKTYLLRQYKIDINTKLLIKK